MLAFRIGLSQGDQLAKLIRKLGGCVKATRCKAGVLKAFAVSAKYRTVDNGPDHTLKVAQ